jgi:predicted Zn finger-like uncharacterized protein
VCFREAATAARIISVIISCPNCSARYRIAATAIPETGRMRCAACGHRWTLEPDDDLPVAPSASPEMPPPPPEPAPVIEAPVIDAPVIDAPAPAEAVSIEAVIAEEEDAEPASSPLLRNIVAIVIGGALAVGAAGLWVARIDPERLPVLGHSLAALAPQPLPLEVTFTARTSTLPSGDRLLEINGKVRNSGQETVTLPDLEVRLAGPGGTLRRWRIAPPVSSLAPRAGVTFASTATGFPADANLVGIRPAR